jgi:hypothetical protein
MVLNEGDLVVVSESQFVFMGYSTLKKLTLIASGKKGLRERADYIGGITERNRRQVLPERQSM